jgi:DNA-binding transcriptional MerR regulator
MGMADDERYGIGELAHLGGVTRRTVRYYVREGLLPPALGVGRGRHYGREHVERLLAVKALQEEGRSLEEIRGLGGKARSGAGTIGPRAARPSISTAWTRLEVVPGIEVHVSRRRRVPDAEALAELAEWCRRHLRDGGG